MGAVYEVEHARTGERLALKVLLSHVGTSAGELERFKREARAPARIKSEHVVRVTDADIAPELEGAPFLVMELLEGVDLEREAAATPPSPATVVEWLRQVARALDKAHRLGIVHRDLKPENLFLSRAEDRPPIVKILDFGILKLVEEGTGATDSGQILGTPRYMAPEQASAKARVTAAADRYALGLVAYRLLTGENYYKGDVFNVLAQLLHEPLELPSHRHPSVGSAFDAWFLRACDRAPERRFSSTSEQIEALAAALGLPTVAREVGGRSTLESRPPRSRRGIAGAAAVLAATGLVAVSLAGIIHWRSKTTRAGVGPPVVSSPALPLPLPPSPPSAGAGAPAIASQASAPPEAPTAAAKSVPARGSAKVLSLRRKAPGPPPIVGSAPQPEAAPQPKAPDPYADQK